MFSMTITAIMLVASTLTPVGAWGSPVAIRSPRGFAMSSTVVSAVEAITTARSSTALDADINDLVAHVAKGSYSLAAVLSAKSRGAPSSYEAAVLQNVLDATESSCPLQGSNNMYDDGDRTTKKGNKDKNKTTAAAASSHSDCATKHDECMASCSSGGLFSRGKTPAAGTCTLVCTVLQEGCKRCNRKRKRHAAGIMGKAFICSIECAQTTLRVIMALLRVGTSPFTFVFAIVKENILVPVVDFFTYATIWVAITVIGWGLAIKFSRENAQMRNQIAVSTLSRPGATLDISSMPVATVVEEVEEVACRPRPGAAMMNISSMPVGTVVEEVEEEATVALPVAVGVAVVGRLRARTVRPLPGGVLPPASLPS